MKDEDKEKLEVITDVLAGVISFTIIFGVGLTLFVGFLKLAIWIWSI